jgi:hypothetical protein
MAHLPWNVNWHLFLHLFAPVSFDFSAFLDRDLGTDLPEISELNFLNINKSQITNHKSQITNHKSQITNYKLQITNHKSQITNHKSQITNHKSQITNHKSQITNHKSYWGPGYRLACKPVCRPLTSGGRRSLWDRRTGRRRCRGWRRRRSGCQRGLLCPPVYSIENY